MGRGEELWCDQLYVFLKVEKGVRAPSTAAFIRKGVGSLVQMESMAHHRFMVIDFFFFLTLLNSGAHCSKILSSTLGICEVYFLLLFLDAQWGIFGPVRHV